MRQLSALGLDPHSVAVGGMKGQSNFGLLPSMYICVEKDKVNFKTGYDGKRGKGSMILLFAVLGWNAW